MDLNSELFQNWTKSALALNYACDPLGKFVEPLNRKQHQIILKNTCIQAGGQCSTCSFQNAKKCPQNQCNKLVEGITAAHRYKKPSFTNKNLNACWKEHWEFAKCFMSAGYKDVHTASKTDFVGFVNMIINNFEYQQEITEDLSDINNIFIRTRELRNNIMHTATFEVTKQTLDYNIKILVDLLNVIITGYGLSSLVDDSKESDIDNVRLAISKIEKLRSGDISQEDKRHVLLQAVESLKKVESEIRQTALDVKDFCEKELIQKTEEGKSEIEATVSSGKRKLEDVKDRAVKEFEEIIKEATEEGKEIIGAKTSEATGEIEDRAKVSAEKASRQISEIVESQAVNLRNIAKESKEGLTQDLEAMKKEGEELKRKADSFDEIRNINIDKLNQITQRCMEKICQEATKMGESMKQPQIRLGETLQGLVEERLRYELLGLREEVMNIKSESDNEGKRMREELSELTAKMTNVIRTNKRLKVQHQSDSKNSYITGMVKLDDTKLVVADHNNSCIKVIDVNLNKIIAAERLPAECMLFGVTAINSKEIVATYSNHIVFLRMENENLGTRKHIEIDGQPIGIIYNKHAHTLVVSFIDRFMILDVDGARLNTFSIQQNRALIQGYLSFVSSEDNEYLIVVDTNNKRILHIDIMGNILRQYKNKNLVNPRGLTVDESGNIYVADYEKHTIVKINKDLTSSEVLLDVSYSLVSPEVITYSQSDKCLYISTKDKTESRIHIHPF